MARFFSHTPRRGKPIALKGFAEGLANLEKAWENLIVIGGKLTWASDGITPVIDLEAGEAAAGYKKTWDIKELDDDNKITIENCWVMRGPIAKKFNDLSWQSEGTGQKTLSAKINTDDMTAELVAGGAGEAYVVSVEELDNYYYLPLYVIKREDEDESWQITVDLRNMPQLGIML